MKPHRHDASPQPRIRLRSVAFVAIAGLAFLQGPVSRAEATAPAVAFHVVTAGGASLQSSCFRLSGSVGQIAPGYSSNVTDSIVAGFWAAAPATALDEIHFNGFEAC